MTFLLVWPIAKNFQYWYGQMPLGHTEIFFGMAKVTTGGGEGHADRNLMPFIGMAMIRHNCYYWYGHHNGMAIPILLLVWPVAIRAL